MVARMESPRACAFDWLMRTRTAAPSLKGLELGAVTVPVPSCRKEGLTVLTFSGMSFERKALEWPAINTQRLLLHCESHHLR
jgi:hypothetical protein